VLRVQPVTRQTMWPANLEFRTKGSAHRYELLKKLIESLDVLPSTQRVPIRVLELHRGGGTLGDLTEAVLIDPSLSVRLLQLANRAYPSQCVDRVSRAAQLIGMNRLLPVLFGASLAGIHSRADLPPSQRDGLWKSSLLKAIVARHFTAQRDPQLNEIAFTCGLLQDIAIPVMLACDPSATTELMLAVDQDSATAAGRERDLFGLSHAAIAALIAQRLGLPDVYQSIFKDHHEKSGPALPPELEKIAVGLRLAATLPHITTGETPGFGERFARQLALEHPEMVAEIKPLKESLTKEFTQIIAAVGGKSSASDSGNFRTFMHDVCDSVARTLSKVIDESVRTESWMETRISQLESKAVGGVDPLTGLLDRVAFLDRAADLLKLAGALGASAALGMADIDDFKSINAQHGQPAGDATLRAVGKSLSEVVGKRGLAARLAKDQFAFVMVVEADQPRSAAVEALQHVFRQQSCKVGSKAFNLTFSCGMQWVSPPAPVADCAAELQKASMLMEAVKKSGKNRCAVQQPPQRVAA